MLPVVPRPVVSANSPAWLTPALFGRALCSGQVLAALKPVAADLEARARQMTSETLRDGAVLALRTALAQHRIQSCADLAKAWKANPRVLLREMAALLSEAKRLHLVEIWPLVLVQADQAAAGGGRGGGNVPAAGGSKRKRGASTR